MEGPQRRNGVAANVASPGLICPSDWIATHEVAAQGLTYARGAIAHRIHSKKSNLVDPFIKTMILAAGFTVSLSAYAAATSFAAECRTWQVVAADAMMRNAAANVQQIVVPNAGRCLMKKAPAATIAAGQGLLATY